MKRNLLSTKLHTYKQRFLYTYNGERIPWLKCNVGSRRLIYDIVLDWWGFRIFLIWPWPSSMEFFAYSEQIGLYNILKIFRHSCWTPYLMLWKSKNRQVPKQIKKFLFFKFNLVGRDLKPSLQPGKISIILNFVINLGFNRDFNCD